MNLSEIFNIERFKKKLGPLPVWAWGLILGCIAALVYFMWQSRNGATVETLGVEEDENFAEADRQQSAANTGFAGYLAALEDASKIPPISNTTSPVSSGSDSSYSGGGYGGGYSAGYTEASYDAPVSTISGQPLKTPLGIAKTSTKNSSVALERQTTIYDNVFGPVLGGWFNRLLVPAYRGDEPAKAYGTAPLTKGASGPVYFGTSAVDEIAAPTKAVAAAPPKVSVAAPTPLAKTAAAAPAKTVAYSAPEPAKTYVAPAKTYTPPPAPAPAKSYAAPTKSPTAVAKVTATPKKTPRGVAKRV